MLLTTIITLFSASTIFGLIACLGASRSSRLEDNFYKICDPIKETGHMES